MSPTSRRRCDFFTISHSSLSLNGSKRFVVRASTYGSTIRVFLELYRDPHAAHILPDQASSRRVPIEYLARSRFNLGRGS
jgi:hypothetical protein